MPIPMLLPLPLRWAVLAGLLWGAVTAQAHDTWFHALPPVAGAPVLALGTGNRFPVQESGVGAEFLERQGCRLQGSESRQAAQRLMRPLHNIANALVLRGPPLARSCWAQLVPLDLELPADKIEIYLREVQAGPALRAAWADMQRRGVPWIERYTKHARIDFAAGDGEPTPMAMDIVREATSDGSLSFRVLRQRQPLPGLAVEWVGDSSPLGIWRRTDADGRVRLPALPPGRWVMRGIDLRPVAGADRWESGFVTLAFDVPTAPARVSDAATPPLR